MVGGLRHRGEGALITLASVERRSHDGAWHELAPLPIPIAEPAIAELSNGAVLVSGGYDDDVSARCFVMRDDTWEETTPLSCPRAAHAMVVLADGRVLAIGGQSGFAAEDAIAHAEVWEPASGHWTKLDGPCTTRHGHSTTLLADGRVLIIGGRHEGAALATAELWSP